MQDDEEDMKEEEVEEEADEEEKTKAEKEEDEHKIPPKKPSRRVQKNQPPEQIIGNKDARLEAWRRILSPKQQHLTLLSTIEPNNFEEDGKDEFLNKAMDE